MLDCWVYILMSSSIVYLSLQRTACLSYEEESQPRVIVNVRRSSPIMGYAVAQLVEALRYKVEVAVSFPDVVDSASNRND
jgi:hypothetical protein